MKTLCAIGLAGAMVLAGCETTTIQNGRVKPATSGSGLLGFGSSGGGVGTAGGLGLEPVVVPLENDAALDSSDPCVQNLEQLTGALLLYYSVHHQMPPALDAVGTLPDGAKISLVCPKNAKRYVYQAQGLREPPEWLPVNAPGGGNRLILYDADPAHEITRHLTNGSRSWDEKQTVRYGIIMDPSLPGRPVKMYVIPVEQKLLNGYLRGGPAVRSAAQ